MVPQLGDWPIVGRDEELAVLRGELVDRGRSVVIAGPAGVGKTRLAREAVRLATTDGTPARYVTATRSSATTPLGALLGLVDDVGVDDRHALLRHVRRALRHDGGPPPVIGVDDAHLLDDGSASVLHRLAEDGDARLVMTLRVGEHTPDAVTAIWRDDLAERIDLQPLGRADVRALLRATVAGADDEGTAHRLWSATGGNPLYLRELAREALRLGDLRVVDGGWAWDARRVPIAARLRELVARSLTDLDDAERDVLELLAVGEPLPPDVLDADAVRACERRGLAVVDESGSTPMLRLHHPLLGEVLRSSLPVTDRRRVARRLAELPGMEERDPVRTATWALDAGLGGDGGRLTAAAVASLRRFDPVPAERLSRAAVAAGGRMPASLVLARALIAQERYADAEAVLAPLEQEAAGDADVLAVAKLLSDVRYWGLGRAGDADAGLVAAGERVASDVARLHLFALRASVRNDAGDITGALEFTRWALDPSVDVGARMQAVTSAASALTLSGRPVDALALCDELLPVALERMAEDPATSGGCSASGSMRSSRSVASAKRTR